MKNKKAQAGNFVGFGIALVILVVIIVVGMTIGQNLAKSQASCGSIGGDTGTVYNTATGLCTNTSGSTGSTGGLIAATAYTVTGYLGTSTAGGLGTWVPTIVAIVIGVFAIALIAGGFGRKEKY